MGAELEFAQVWPFAALWVTSGDLELRYADDDLLWQAAQVAARGVHAPDFMPFTTPWSRGTPEQVAQAVLRYHWGVRAQFVPEDFACDMVAVRVSPGGEQVVGMQGFTAKDFAVTRTAETGSWLGQEFQGQGMGTRLRHMIVHLLFALGAQVATTAAFADNLPSQGVTRKLGYQPNGIDWVSRDGAMAESVRYCLTREVWDGLSKPADITVHGLEPVRQYLLG